MIVSHNCAESPNICNLHSNYVCDSVAVGEQDLRSPDHGFESQMPCCHMQPWAVMLGSWGGKRGPGGK